MVGITDAGYWEDRLRISWSIKDNGNYCDECEL
jgi:hypothetical protein